MARGARLVRPGAAGARGERPPPAGRVPVCIIMGGNGSAAGCGPGYIRNYTYIWTEGLVWVLALFLKRVFKSREINAPIMESLYLPENEEIRV